jgi:hypothetical protein
MSKHAALSLAHHLMIEGGQRQLDVDWIEERAL